MRTFSHEMDHALKYDWESKGAYAYIAEHFGY